MTRVHFIPNAALLYVILRTAFLFVILKLRSSWRISPLSPQGSYPDGIGLRMTWWEDVILRGKAPKDLTLSTMCFLLKAIDTRMPAPAGARGHSHLGFFGVWVHASWYTGHRVHRDTCYTIHKCIEDQFHFLKIRCNMRLACFFG